MGIVEKSADMETVAITGAGGFIGAYLVRKLLELNYGVRAIDNFSRGDPERLKSIKNPNLTIYKADVREEKELIPIFEGCTAVFHLAAINGTENFYKHPDLVLDVGVRGMLAVANASLKTKIASLIVASSAEVYQTPAKIPTDENIALTIPDSLNPRYSYGGSKLISELIAFNYCGKALKKVQVFRPHNVYGPDMGWKHVIPQLIEKIEQSGDGEERTISIQGDGTQTRAFCYVDDIVDGIITMWLKGDSMNVYHIGAMREISIKELAEEIAKIYEVRLTINPGTPNKGETPRRCPDISKMAALGYSPKVSLNEGLKRTIEWYRRHAKTKENNLL